jgi:predicted Zn finger-like uncharacterized protein
MKITCQSCQAKYTIADEKVVGKVVKIRCKKCGSTIVVNGSDPTASAGMGQGAEGAAEGWTVNVAEGDQRTMTDEEVVTAYRARVIDDETYCWKDGMGDWAPLREIPSLYGPCTAGSGAAARGPEAASSTSDVNGSGGGAPTAARRAGGRAVAADLFGTAAQAGSEEDVMTSAPSKMPQAHEDAQKLTGARNENSVLFSLNTLTGKSDPPPPPNSEASGLIDIRQLSAQFGTVDDAKNKKKSSRVDDIMNLSGGGAFMPTLTAPALAPPPVEAVSVGSSGKPGSAAPGKSRGLILLAVGGGVLVILLAIGGAVSLMRGKSDDTAAKDKPASSASSAGLAAADTATTGAAASASAASEAPAAPASAGPAATAAATETTAAPTAAAPPTPTKVASQSATPHEAPVAAARPAAAAESDQPFNMGEAKARLAAVAGAVQACKKPSGPTGTGRVVVVFGPSGAAQSANVTGDPFEGTATGGCVAAHFRAVRVPAFGGSPFSVSKSFSIN